MFQKYKVYIETSIPSFYFEIREEAEMVARKRWTRQWWKNHREDFDLFTSVVVLDELNAGNHPNKNECLDLISSLPLLPVEFEISDIVNTYIDNHVMPKDPTGDALHLALASYHQCHFLLTWNCVHLANANKKEHIRHINNLMGLFVPELTTPLGLIKEEYYE